VEMLTGHPPWHELEPMAALFKIAHQKKAQYTLGSHVSEQARHFIQRTFANQKDRPVASELLLDPFIVTEYG